MVSFLWNISYLFKILWCFMNLIFCLTLTIGCIHELDKLSKEAQSGLRRTMEKYMANCRIIFNWESLSKVMAPLKSRWVQIRVPAPKISDIEDTLQQISKFEGFSWNDELARKIAVLCKGNMRKGIMILQGLKANYPSLSASTKVQKPGYEDTISDIADDIVREQTPKQLKLIRSKFYELITKGISANLIICLLTKYLLDRIDDGAKIKLVSESVNWDLRCQLGSKEIIHLEAFAAISMMIVRESRP